ncbi:DNA-binding transcriptional MocR family regulator [Streptomyces sp. 846.5]|nr:PLP-dependent aminotransferase family protein [Streptomyces sp. 846.5]TDU01676.1 DNA-binding transcriptional MocR family regulator [Streptomyces sp. 846.5]
MPHHDHPQAVPIRAEQALTGSHIATLLLQPIGDDASYRELARAISRLVLDGQIALHVRLPSERTLARALGTSRTTVTAAYNQLRDTGFVHSQRGSGTWTSLPSGHALANVSRTAAPEDAAVDLARAAPGLPEEVMAQALTSVSAQLGAHTRTPGYHPYGLLELRRAVADHFTGRGLATTPEQVLVTAGAQHALSLVLGLLCSTGDRVLTETPSYPNALEAMRRHGLRTLSVPVGSQGWDVDIIDATLRQTVPTLAYLIPDFHNPTGLLMPAQTRPRILRTAQRTGTWLVIDESLAELALDVPAPAPFASHGSPAESTRVITIGSMSKTYWGGLRVGWLRAPSDLIDELASQRIATDLGGSVLDQLLALYLLRRAAQLLPPRLELLRQQRAALHEALATQIPAWSWQQPPGGLALWVDLGQPTGSAIADRARHRGVRIESGSWFSADPGVCETRLRIPFTLPAATLHEAVQRLASTLVDLPTAPSQRRPQWIA